MLKQRSVKIAIKPFNNSKNTAESLAGSSTSLQQDKKNAFFTTKDIYIYILFCGSRSLFKQIYIK